MERGDVEPVRFGKWGDRPHWEMDLRYLGSDEFGWWLGSPAGMPMRRPGMTTRTDAECAFLVPRDGDTVRAVDLDLDVVKAWDGTVLVDDEDWAYAR